MLFNFLRVSVLVNLWIKTISHKWHHEGEGVVERDAKPWRWVMPRVGVASVVRGSKQIHRLWRAPLGSTYSATFIACMHQHFCIIYSSSRLPICPFWCPTWHDKWSLEGQQGVWRPWNGTLSCLLMCQQWRVRVAKTHIWWPKIVYRGSGTYTIFTTNWWGEERFFRVFAAQCRMRSLFVGDGFINLDVALGYICNTASIIGAHQTIVGIPTSHSLQTAIYTIFE